MIRQHCDLWSSKLLLLVAIVFSPVQIRIVSVSTMFYRTSRSVPDHLLPRPLPRHLRVMSILHYALLMCTITLKLYGCFTRVYFINIVSHNNLTYLDLQGYRLATGDVKPSVLATARETFGKQINYPPSYLPTHTIPLTHTHTHTHTCTHTHAHTPPCTHTRTRTHTHTHTHTHAHTPPCTHTHTRTRTHTHTHTHRG